MKVAIVYDRVNKFGGAERVLLTLHGMFPDAPLYTSVYSPQKATWAKAFPKVYSSFLNTFTLLQNYHELLSVFMPLAFELLDFSGYDIVISVTSEAAKGIITKPETLHFCYCLTPTRYLYSSFRDYEDKPPGKLKLIPFYKTLSKPFIRYMKYWDRFASKRPDQIIAISTEVKNRIKTYYGRESRIVFPPVDIEKFKTHNSNLKVDNIIPGLQTQNEDYYLIVSRLEPYKKVDLAIDAFVAMKKKLVVVGTGSEEKKYITKYGSLKNIFLTGFIGDNEVVSLYQKAKGFIYPQVEDFGITAVEAQAAGCPVIAYKKGGSLDTVIDGKTGVFFKSQKVDSLINAVKRFEKIKFKKKTLQKNAEKFNMDRFRKEILDLIDKTV